MSPAAIDQRRAAPWKTGERARSLLTQTVHPCKPNLCPLTDPEHRGNCSIKRAMAEQEKNLEACPVALVVNEETRNKIKMAIDGGGLEGVNDLTANILAGMHQLGVNELAKLQRDGFSIERPIVGKDSDGNAEIIGYVPSVNPGAEPTLKLLDMLGATAAAASITNKSRGEKAAAESIDDLARMLAGRAASRVVDVTPISPEKKAIEP